MILDKLVSLFFVYFVFSDFDFITPLSLGLMHSLEADHLITVASIAIERDKISDSIKDGFFWGLGHLVIILVFGIIILGIKFFIHDSIFQKAEILVGFFMLFIGISRIKNSFQKVNSSPDQNNSHSHNHNLSLIAGLIHGVSGSSIIMLIAFKYETNLESFTYLSIFGMAALVSMMLASFLLKLFVGKKILSNPNFKKFLIFISGIICLIYGVYLVFFRSFNTHS